MRHRQALSWLLFTFLVTGKTLIASGCKFYPIGENRRFERVAENLPVGNEVFRVEVHPRAELKLEAVDNSLSDINYFKYEEVDEKTVAIKLAHSLEDLVDRRDPQSVLKFKLTCKGSAGTEEAFLPVTVYVQDVNDHAPEFQNVPYNLEVDELTPVGLTVFRGIHAVDRDKPNTANSDITYLIVGGNENNSFILSDPIEGILVINKPLDYDNGIREFKIQIQASDHGSPISLSQVTTMTIRVKDADDQNPVFTQEVYKASVSETAKITGHRIREKVAVQPAIHAFDLDTGINARLRYAIILGNEGGFFEMHDQTGELFLVREIDLESLPNTVLSLQIQASQVDNPLRQALARVDVLVMDVNDNSPEFEYDMYNITVMENLPPGFTVLQVYAVDADRGENADFKYLLHDESGAFKIDQNTGWISVRDPGKLDRESKERIHMTVSAVERKPNLNPDSSSAKTTTVEINLLDANDNNPQFFPTNLYTFNVLETAPSGTLVGSVFATDKDLNENGRVVYSKQNDSISQNVPFDVHPHNGSIFVLDSFSHSTSKPEQYTFFVVASDLAKIHYERRTGVAVIRINVTDINNSIPEFIGAPFEAYVGESLPEGAFVTQIAARDADSVNTQLEYSIVAGNDEKLFIIDSRAGRIFTASVLDFERKQSYDLLVQVSDGINTAVAPLLVNVVDINDNLPVFTHNSYNFSVVEEIAENVTVGTVLALDRDSGKNSVVRYGIVGDHANEAFHIESLTGNIKTRLRLDREADSVIDFVVVAYDNGIPQLSGTASVRVKIEDINDNSPYFEQDTYEVEVPEEIEPPFDIFQVKAHDRDANDNAVIKYLILAGNEDNAFNINADTGLLSTADKLNYERKQEYHLHIAARNLRPFQGPVAQNIVNPAVKVIVKIRDVNDELVVFDQQSYHFRIFENMPRSQTIGFLNATNPRRLSNEQDILYWIGEENKKQKGKFWINPKSGELILMDTVDRDAPANEQSFKLKIFARDRLSINSFNTSVPVIIDVLDINDNAPTFNEERYVLELPESLPIGTTLPNFYRVQDIDAGANGKISSYHLEGDPQEVALFSINNVTGAITLIGPLDYEAKNKHEFSIIAVDGGSPPNIGTTNVLIQVSNINEFSPKFVGLPYEFVVQEKAFEGTSVGQVKANDEDGNRIKYSISDGDVDFFSIEEDSGRIFVKKALISRTHYNFIARATDDGIPQNFSLGVQVIVRIKEANDFPPIFTSNSYHGTVVEKKDSDKIIAKVEAIDKDLQNNTITYSIVGGNEDEIFAIGEHNGQIKIIPGQGIRINYDNKKQYVLLVQATDSHVTPLYALSMVVIDVHDTNDHPPVFSKTVYSASISENLPSGHCFLNVEAKSGDSVDRISYLISNNKDHQAFEINKQSGEICTKSVLDREKKDKYEFAVIATDGKFEALVPVSVEILDENDNPPKFELDHYLISIPYDAPPGRSVIQVQATDPDGLNNGDVTYWIKNTHGMFEIDAKTGLVRLVARLPTDNQNATYEMEIFAQDHGVSPNIGRTSLVVKASNTLNHPPKFDRFSYSVSVDENISGIPIIQVVAHDPNPGKAGKVVYRIVKSTNPNAFRIDKHSGRITVESPLDYETTKYHEVVVEARDEAKEPQFVTAVVQITVQDVNDNAPEILSFPRVVRVSQSATPNHEVIYTVQSNDLDSDRNGNNQVHYAIDPPSSFFVINALTGQIFATQKLIPLTERLRITATDQSKANPLSTSKELTIEVYKDSIEDTIPVFTSVQYLVQSDNVLEPGSSVLTARATIPDGSPVWYNISVNNQGHSKRFAIDHDTGRITTTNRLDPADYDKKQPIFHFIVTAHNRRDPLQASEAGVIVKLLDHNSRCPKFPFNEYYASVKENSQPDTVVLPNLLIEDIEKFSGQRLSYQVTEDNSNDNFYIDVRSGNSDSNANVTLRIKKLLDRDSMPKFLQGIYTLTVTASNQRCSANARIKIMVEDVNDNNPVFSQNDFVVELKENTPIGHVVTILTATDKDEVDDGKLRYFIVEGNEEEVFDMEEKSGVISVKVIPDREKSPAYVLKIVAIDSGNNTGWASLHIAILDENDWTPTFLNETFFLNVTEGPNSLGTRLRLPVVDYDDGINRQMEVYIIDGNANGEFRLDVDEGGPLLTIVSELDREKYGVEEAALHLVFVAAKDKGSPPRLGKAMVAVVIHDINDSPPKFERDSYFQFISEDAPVGVVVGELKATDADAKANTKLVYSFAKTTGNVPFAIDPLTGVVNISRQLDISESQQYVLTVEVFDGLWKTSTSLNIFISEAEERDPRFDQPDYRFAVHENLAGVLIGRVELKPRKLRVNAMMKYTIVNSEMKSLFNITSDGEIYTRVGLDREKRSQYVFTVKLEERHPSTKISVSEVIVDVLDVNDEVPTFHQAYRGTIKENSPPGTTVNIVPPIQAIDNDAGNNSLIKYHLSGRGSEMFTILDSGTVLFTPMDPSQVLDREQTSQYNLRVSAVDTGNLSSTTDFTIVIEDENDNAPVFLHGPLFVLLPEIARPGSKVVEVKATDADEKGPNSKIQYYITSGGRGDIRIDRLTGEIFVVGSLRPDTVYFLNVSAVDGAGLTAKTTVNVTIVDVNNHKPTFDQNQYEFDVLEGNYTSEKLKLGVLRARDEDIGKNGVVEYSILNNVAVDFPFSIDIYTGELFAKGFIDRELRESYNFEVTALDNGEPPSNTSTEVKIKVLDRNDERPRFYTDPYLAHVPENLDPGHKVTQIAAFDPDLGENGQVFYKLGEGHDNKFYIDGKDGTVWTLSSLDFEEKNFYNITVIAYDKGSPSLHSVAKLWVTVADTSDAVPDFGKAVYTLEVAENAKPGDTVFTLNAGEGPFKYSLLNANEIDTFVVEPTNGRIKLAKPLDSVHRNHYRLMVKAEDDSDPPKSDSAEVNIIIGTGQGVRLFPQRLYEVFIMENQLAPKMLIDLNSTDEIAHKPTYYTIVGTDYKGLFKIESDSGRLFVTRSLDRERKDMFNLKIKAENVLHRRVGRDVSNHLVEQNYHLAFDEALVVVNIQDENDNHPVFENKGRPIVAAVPLEATFGYQVAKVSAKDADTGINGAIRYEILTRGDDASSKFYIDSVSGVIRSMVTFALDGGKLYGFDVKATDKEGHESGNSAVTNIFVYVLPETKMVLFVADKEPILVEKKSNDILHYLTNITGFEVKMAKLEPHTEGENQETHSTDLFLYAVNPETNDIVDTDTLLDVFRQNSQLIVDGLRQYRIRRIQGVTVQEKISQMGATEIAIIALSSVIFLGTVLAIALLCSSCKERKLRKRQASWEQQRLYGVKNPLMNKQLGNPYGSRGIPVGNGQSSSTYSTGDGAGSEYVDSLASYKRGVRPGSRSCIGKSRQQVPPDGASSLNPPRSPRFNDRYKPVTREGPHGGVTTTVDSSRDWFDPKENNDSVGSGYSRGSGRSGRSGYSGTSWSSRKSRNSERGQSPSHVQL